MNLYFISPILPVDSALWGVVLGNPDNQRKSLDGSKITGKISEEFSTQYSNGEGFAGLTGQQIDDFITANGIQVYTYNEITAIMQGAEWTDYSTVPS